MFRQWWQSREHPGGTPLYKLYRYMPPHRVGFLRRLGLKTGIHFAHFGLESGMVCEGTTGVYERLYRFYSRWVRKQEDYANSKWVEEFSVCLRSNLSNDNIISAQRSGLKTGMNFRSLVWKRVWKITFFGLKAGRDLDNRAAYPHQEFPGVPPRPRISDKERWFG